MNKAQLNKIQSVLDTAVDTDAMAGASCLVWQGGRGQGYYESGYADREAGRRFARNTICRFYSMTKPVTAVAVWTLIESGKIDLLDDVFHYLPSFAMPMVCSGNAIVTARTPITIRDLLNMTSGYTYGGSENESQMQTASLVADLNSSLLTDSPITTQQFAERIAAIPLSFEPGSNFEYGFSADILGAVVETVSGMKFGDYLRRFIFEPLGMKDTAFYVPAAKMDRLAEEYQHTLSGSLEVFAKPNLGIPYRAEVSPAFESGGAGLVGTIDDYMRFCRMLLSGGTLDGLTVLQPQTVQALRSYHIADNVQQYFNKKLPHLCGYSYGNLMRILVEPALSGSIGAAGEFGWDGWLGTFMLVDPSNELAFVYLQQVKDAGYTPVARRIKNVIYAAL